MFTSNNIYVWRCKAMSETKDYTRRAVRNYQNKFDYVNVRFSAGTKERIQAAAQGRSMSEFISDIIYQQLDMIEGSTADPPNKASNKQ